MLAGTMFRFEWPGMPLLQFRRYVLPRVLAVYFDWGAADMLPGGAILFFRYGWWRDYNGEAQCVLHVETENFVDVNVLVRLLFFDQALLYRRRYENWARCPELRVEHPIDQPTSSLSPSIRFAEPSRQHWLSSILTAGNAFHQGALVGWLPTRNGLTQDGDDLILGGQYEVINAGEGRNFLSQFDGEATGVSPRATYVRYVQNVLDGRNNGFNGVDDGQADRPTAFSTWGTRFGPLAGCVDFFQGWSDPIQWYIWSEHPRYAGYRAQHPDVNQMRVMTLQAAEFRGIREEAVEVRELGDQSNVWSSGNDMLLPLSIRYRYTKGRRAVKRRRYEPEDFEDALEMESLSESPSDSEASTVGYEVKEVAVEEEESVAPPVGSPTFDLFAAESPLSPSLLEEAENMAAAIEAAHLLGDDDMPPLEELQSDDDL